MKKILTVIVAAALAALMLFTGCSVKDGRDGRDGKSAQDVTVYDLYEAAKTIPGNENLSLEEFLKEYLTYDKEDVENQTGLQSVINKSLMSGVSILSRFAYTQASRPGSIPGLSSTRTTYKVYSGSGAILWLDKSAGDAYVVTNCHVIYDDTSDSTFCQDIRLYLYGQDENDINYKVDLNYNISGDENYRMDAEIIGASVTYDIALLKVSDSEVLRRSDAVASSFSMQADVNVGEYVYAVGNASGEGVSASNGIISRDSENILLSLKENAYYEDDYVSYRVLRTTAAVNHGNSGGALYNTKGEIIAIVNAKSDEEGADNMGYALPANSVRRLLSLMYENYVDNGNKMLTNGGVYKAMLNVKHDVTDTYSQYNKETGLAEIYEQIKVLEVSGAPSQGVLREGDYFRGLEILGADGEVKQPYMEITRRYHLPEAMLSVREGDTLNLTVERDETETKLSIKFDSSKYFKNYVV